MIDAQAEGSLENEEYEDFLPGEFELGLLPSEFETNIDTLADEIVQNFGLLTEYAPTDVDENKLERFLSLKAWKGGYYKGRYDCDDFRRW